MNDKWINLFINKALPKIIEKTRTSKIIIFGSRLRKNAEENSDIDIIIVSDYFKDVHIFQRMPILLKLVRFEKTHRFSVLY